MKKLMIASAIAMTMAAGSAMAATNMGTQQNEIQFLGVVTEVTCDIDAVVDGAVNNVVQLGTVKKGEEGDVKNIVLKAKDPAQCTGLDAVKKATIAFKGPLGDAGLVNDKGTAEGAVVSLVAKNSETANKAINKTDDIATFSANLVTGAGYQFEAKLDATNATATGTFDSALAYAVTYQ